MPRIYTNSDAARSIILRGTRAKIPPIGAPLPPFYPSALLSLGLASIVNGLLSVRKTSQKRDSVEGDRIGEASLADVSGCFFFWRYPARGLYIYPLFGNADAERTGTTGLVIEEWYRRILPIFI
jgi:hypothetical protein